MDLPDLYGDADSIFIITPRRREITCRNTHLQEALCADPDPAAGAGVEQRVVHHADRALLEPIRRDVDLAAEQEHLLDHREDQHLKQ